ncbi:MAG: TonB terminal [Pseudomonadota bacterium]|nr:TonB terminal [Pseudomonadota bacterium]
MAIEDNYVRRFKLGYNLQSERKKSLTLILSVIISILLHFLVIVFMLKEVGHDHYLPTSTKGYTVDIVRTPINNQDADKLDGVANKNNVVKFDNNAANAISSDKEASAKFDRDKTKAQVNFKNDSKIKVDAKANKAAKNNNLMQKNLRQNHLNQNHLDNLHNSKNKYRNRLDEVKYNHNLQKSVTSQRSLITPSNNTTKKTLAAADYVDSNNISQQKDLIVAASAPIVDKSKLGAGDSVDSSTNGDGTQSSGFDFRVIEYGREAAYAINQNIVVPDQYRYTHVSYRAFIMLDRNMQFQDMQLIKSTGNPEFDDNIARALRQTVYPPLPDGADWNRFHNIDFTIH